jgi:hypothetical protein
MRTIIDNAESALQEAMEQTNERIRLRFIRRNEDYYDLFSFKSYVLHESKTNPDFFKWLFDDPEITFFGTSLSEAQREEFNAWLHDL